MTYCQLLNKPNLFLLKNCSNPKEVCLICTPALISKIPNFYDCGRMSHTFLGPKKA